MQKLSLNEIREKYLSFFESKGHLRLPSFSLVPQNDPSILLINAGMTPLKPYFTGAEKPPRTRVTTCQKCIRTPDVERVGQTARHGTYFEMLGNFSFGDYFKREAISWAWEFLTEVLEIPQELLYVSVYHDDDEAFDIWHKEIGLSTDRIYRFGKEDNFWEHGTGPCGPCSEIFFDRGPEYGCDEDCEVGCDCDRYIEIWNLVFTQFDRDEDGEYHLLEQKNIDTGGGLERFACVMQGVDNLFEVDTVRSVLDQVCEIAGVNYGKSEKDDVAIRVITDHIRSSTMMISDHITPGNSGRGYVLRRLIRRAARFGRLLGIEGAFLYKLAEEVIKQSEVAYPQLREESKRIIQTLLREEQSFAATIDQGMNVLESYIETQRAQRSTELTGEQVFKLHDTYGFPVDLTQEIAAEQGLTVDRAGFDQKMLEQKQKGREDFLARTGSAWDKLQLPDCVKREATEFLGYECLSADVQLLHILTLKDKLEDVESAEEGEEVILITDQTPFYAERGGQIGDTGTLVTPEAEVEIIQVTHTGDNIYLHQGIVKQGTLTADQLVNMSVDVKRRRRICSNHTSTHMLHLALRKILGDHVQQAGSLVAADRLRFDFTHPAPVSTEELAAIEEDVNNQILAAESVITQEMPLNEAKQLGATALFGEKYGDIVRVVKVGDSLELCGGTHLNNSSEAGQLRIVAETGVASGVRRIEAVTQQEAYHHGLSEHAKLTEAAGLLKCSNKDINQKISNLLSELKSLESQIQQLKKSQMQDLSTDLLKDVKTVTKNGKDLKVLLVRVEDIESKELRELGDKLRNQGVDLIVFGSVVKEKILWLVMASKEAVSSGLNCGLLAKQAAQLTGGGGGGRPDMAQAGGSDVSQLDNALAKVAESIDAA